MSDVTIRVNLRHAPSVGIVFEEASMTQQHFKDECDIDKILKKYNETGFLVNPLESRRPAKWGDFSSVNDYQQAMNKLVEVQEAFDSLPSKVRERFRNDPMQMLAFLEDEKNIDEAVSLGLVSPPAKNAPQTNEKASPSASETSSSAPLPEGA